MVWIVEFNINLICGVRTDPHRKSLQTFRAGPAPSRAPATTPNPNILNPSAVSIGPTASSHPTVDAILMTVVLQLDTFSSETSFFIDSSDGLTNFLARPVGHYEEMKSQKIIETVRLPQGLEYQFRIVDFMGEVQVVLFLFISLLSSNTTKCVVYRNLNQNRRWHLLLGR